MLTLANIKKGELFRILSMKDLEESLYEKLRIFGFIEGGEGSIKRVAPFGDPLEVKMDDASVFIRSVDASKIFVEKI
jgi:Fe2+ transport system protein FeoA